MRWGAPHLFRQAGQVRAGLRQLRLGLSQMTTREPVQGPSRARLEQPLWNPTRLRDSSSLELELSASRILALLGLRLRRRRVAQNAARWCVAVAPPGLQKGIGGCCELRC